MNFMRCLALVLAGAATFACNRSHDSSAPTVESTPANTPADEIPGATLIPGLGNQHFPISSTRPDVQRWFDQGLMLTFGFNHDAAERSFLMAASIDPDCAMCWWGAALVLGPHVNAGMEPTNNEKAWKRLQRARALATNASPREQAFIEALAARYAEQPPENRRALDEAYAASTGELMRSRPDDLDAATFHAEALMDLQPWDYYDDQRQPKGHTNEIVATLESVMQRDPDHAGALHLHVHAVEASLHPERGVAAADHLRDLIPGSGHLVHMPAHIYSRVGRWHDAVIANQVAIKADDTYLTLCSGNTGGLYSLGYVPHNHHFLWFAASMEGNSAIARAAALHTAERTSDEELLRKPGFEAMQHYWMTPWFDDVRFGRWKEIDGKPNPAADLPYVSVIWHYAEGIAAARLGRRNDAEQHLLAMRPMADDPAMQKMLVWERYPLSLAAHIAERSLTAELALLDKDFNSAIAALREATAIEDQIPYDEPPGWHSPTRHALGAALLDAGKAEEAEAVYRADLERNPGNGWSLRGLALSLRAQKHNDDAGEVETRFEAAWQNADVKLESSRL
jgi:tetratricopeptide (TPR) repeat protein